MALSRFFGFVDLGVATVVAVAIFLPAREMYASNAIKGDEFALALAEARTMARPGDGLATEEFTRQLGNAGARLRRADQGRDHRRGVGGCRRGRWPLRLR